MFKNYLRIALRNLTKHKLYSTINIVGLATGLAACIVIMLFVYYENNFDADQPSDLYRLNEVQKFPGMVSSQKVALSMYPMAKTLKEDFPEILNITHVRWNDEYQVTAGDKRMHLPRNLGVDSTFLQMFHFPLKKGNAATALQEPHSAILTESAARKLFGDADPMGKTFVHYAEDTVSFKVTGITANPPSNSQLQFDMLSSFSTYYQPWMIDNWGGNWLNTYMKLAPNTNTSAMEKKFPAFLKRHMREDNYKYYELFLLPYSQVHAHAADIGLDYVNYQKFDARYTRLFGAIAIIVLLIACINFMNLSTARSMERAKEIGVRKTLGAMRGQVGMQFLAETVMLALLALVIASVMVFATLPFIENLSQRPLAHQFVLHPELFLYFFFGAVSVGIISGLYPAVYLSSFQPSKVLKGGGATGSNRGGFRNVLVVGQFATAIFLIVATIFVYRQSSFMQHTDPGFNRDQVLTVSMNGITFKQYPVLKQQLLQSSMVKGVTASQDQLGSHLDQSGARFRDEDAPEIQVAVTQLIVDPDYLSLYGMKILHGRDFSREKSQNGKEYIINEGLARELNKEHPKRPVEKLIGKQFGYDSLGRIVGIAKDFNFNSLHHKIENLFIANQSDWGFRTVSVKLAAGKAKEGLAMVQAKWAKLYPDQPFEFQFLDDHFKDVYRTDIQITQMVSVFAGLAVLISCLGLFGLASYSAEKRVKEIGVRKVLGASVPNLVSLLSRDFVKLVCVAILIAWPLAWWAISNWMGEYAYHVPMSWWIFLVSGILALGIALATVSTLAWKAARANPVSSLRNE